MPFRGGSGSKAFRLELILGGVASFLDSVRASMAPCFIKSPVRFYRGRESNADAFRTSFLTKLPLATGFE